MPYVNIKITREGITKSDLLVINKIDLADLVGASLEIMDSDTRRMRGDKPYVFTNLRTEIEGLQKIVEFICREGMLVPEQGAALAASH